MAAAFEADQDAPPFMYINSRLTSVRTPEHISEALCDLLTSPSMLQKVRVVFQRIVVKFGTELKAPSIGWGKASVSFQDLVNFLKDDPGNLHKTIKKSAVIFEALDSLPLKPVLVIGMAQNPCSNNEKLLLSLMDLILCSHQINFCQFTTCR